ncbi:YfaQ family protein [Escherichia coli]|nr:YfaQ family protein [Escherichia coli]
MNWRRIVWLLALVTLPTLAEETPLQLALRGAQHDQLYQLSSSGVTKVSALPDTLTTPLGSLWKLYVYAWLEDTHQPEQPYQCRGNSPEEVYCCQAGESITRDTALVRSCGLYFAPQRLHIGADVWGQYWQQRQAPAWLASLTTLKPETSVAVKSLLDSLATLPAQNKAQEVLLDVVLDEAKIGVASMLGSRVRVKTWSWFADDKQEIRQGGFAGWLTDGTPLWVTGSGTSKTVLTRYATVLNRVLPVPTQVASGQCVEVELFARYPLKKITAEKSTTAVKPGVLNGRYRVTFTNGNHITFVSHGETTLLSEKGKLKLQSHLDREEYVARVLDREAKSTPPEAAKAWLAKKMPQWRRMLQGETGYNEPDVFAVCRLVSGFPYTDRQQKRLFIRNFFTLQDRLDLTHEYLHLAFDGYPTGLDENYIETLTRQLLMD